MTHPHRIEWRPTVDQVRPLLEEFLAKEGNGMGGVFHCMLEDSNLELGASIGDLRMALDTGDLTTIRLGCCMVMMTATQRGRLSDLYGEICHSNPNHNG